MLRPWLEPAGIRSAGFSLVPEDELETPALPREHPRWVKDALAVSQRARRLFAQLRPAATRVFGFWDHQTRAITIAGRRLSIDPSGSYYVS